MEADRIPIYNAGALAGWAGVGGYLTSDQFLHILGSDKLMTYYTQEELRYVYTIT